MLAALHPFSNRPHLLKYVEEMTRLNEILRRSLNYFPKHTAFSFCG